MAKLPTTLGERALPTPQRRVWSVDNTQMAQAQARAARDTAQAGSDLMAVAEQRERENEKDGMLEAVRRDNEAQKQVNALKYGDGTDANPGLFSARGANALQSQTVFQERYKTIREKAMEGLSNPVAQAALEKSLMSLETESLGSIQRFVQEQRDGYRMDLLDARSKIANERVGLEYNNPDTLTSALGEARSAAVARAKIKGFKEGDAAWTSLVNAEESTVYESQLGAMINSEDPASQARAVSMFDQYKKDGKIKSFETIQRLDSMASQVRPRVEALQAFQNMSSIKDTATAGDPIGFVLHELEGGNKYVKDGAGMAKFGINSAANPDVNVSNLDEKGAREVAQDRYWKANKIDELPENMQLLAFDTAFNHRTDFKDEVIGAIKKGATADDVFLMRYNEYERLARENPEKYAKELPGWKNRLKKLYNRVYSTDGSTGSSMINPADAETVASNLQPEAQKEFQSLVENHNKRIATMTTANRKAIIDQAIPALQTGGFSAVPVELRAKAEQAGLLNDLASYTGATDKDMASYLYSLDPAALAQTDLDDPAIRLKLSPADYQRWGKKKEAMGNPANLVSEKKKQGMVKKAFDERGMVTGGQGETGLAARMRYNRANEMIDLEIDAFTQLNNGRYPTEPELTKIVDNIFLKGEYDVTPGSWWNVTTYGGVNDYKFDIDISEIPENDRNAVAQSLTRRGIPATDAEIIKEYMNGLE